MEVPYPLWAAQRGETGKKPEKLNFSIGLLADLRTQSSDTSYSLSQE